MLRLLFLVVMKMIGSTNRAIAGVGGRPVARKDHRCVPLLLRLSIAATTICKHVVRRRLLPSSSSSGSNGLRIEPVLLAFSAVGGHWGKHRHCRQVSRCRLPFVAVRSGISVGVAILIQILLLLS